MKISIICFDLSNNCLGRAYLLGKVLQRRYDVDIHGFYHDYSVEKNRVWFPCDTGEFQYKAVTANKFPGFVKSALEMVKSIRGDVILASKLRLPSYGVGILCKLLKFRPLILDIDDIEVSWNKHLTVKKKREQISDPIGQWQTEFIEKCTGFANEITTVSTQLRKRYGRGIIIPHGKDTTFFDPQKYNASHQRVKLNINNEKIIMFLGTPLPHKGLEDIVSAINMLDRQDIRLLIVGSGSDNHYERKLLEQGRGKVILHPQIPFLDIPKYLSVADLVVLPQRKSLHAHGQIPAKMIDAMAMAKPIIATNVSDMPDILDGCGFIVEPENIPDLAEKINWVFSHKIESQEMGMRAREKCIKEYSWDVMEDRLSKVIDNF